ncbi:MAG: putative DNA-binding domain-containing protein [Alphaproteobacteria bacterium]|nr:putative DNA-binding domain-containing protein [Alphaproteobacteria bacterium]
MKPPLAALLETFHDGILADDAAATLPHLRVNPRLPREAQLRVYSEGYRVRLIQAVRTDYPAFAEILGEASFQALALDYIAAHPPAHFNLDRYPHGFAAYAQTRVPPFAAELARLEGAIAEAFMAEAGAPLPPAALAGLSPEAFGALRLPLRGGVRLLAFAYPVHAWLEAQREGKSAAANMEEKPNWLCVHRHRNEIRRTPLAAPAFALLMQLGQGLSVAEALDEVLAQQPDAAADIAAGLQSWFAEWMALGVFGE